MELFKVKDLVFVKEDFLDDITDFEDIIPIIQELQDELAYEEISCVGQNDCCEATSNNYIIEIQGFVDENDEFITMDEFKSVNKGDKGMAPFVIRVYKCVQCGKWIFDILEWE